MNRPIVVVPALSSILWLAACGGPSTPVVGPGGPGTGSGATPAGDLSFELDVRELGGRRYQPEALGRPALPQVEPKKKLTLDKHRAEFVAAQQPPAKGELDVLTLEVKGQVLATRLFAESKAAADKGDADGQKAALAEAFATLKLVREKAGAKTGANTLRMLGFHAFTQNDLTTAAAVFGELVALAEPKAAKPAELADLTEFKTYRALALVKAGAYADAATTLGTVAPGTRFDAKDPRAANIGELAYVGAWTAWGTGDGAAAFALIRDAAATWTSAGSQPAVDADLILMAAHAGAPTADVVAALEQRAGGDAGARYASVNAASKAYALAGRFADAATLIDLALAGAGAASPTNDPPALRLRQAEYAMRLGVPADAAARIDAALAALPACGAKCTTEDKVELVGGAAGITNMFYNVFATSLDDRYYKPTKAIYLAIVQHGSAEQKANAEKFTVQLDQFKTNSKPGTGKHDKGVLVPLLAMREQDVVACYEHTLLREPALAGALGLALEVDAAGAIIGATTTPPGGDAGLAAVGRCVEAKARTWTLPARTMPGTTRITASYKLAPKA